MQKLSVYVRLRAEVISYVLNKYSVYITVCSKVHALFMFKNSSLYVPQSDCFIRVTYDLLQIPDQLY